MSEYGNIEVVRQILELDVGEQEEKLLHLKDLANVWLNTFYPSDVLSEVSSDAKDAAVNFYTAYLFTISTGGFTTEVPATAGEFRRVSETYLKQAMNSIGEIYKIRKVNK